MATKPGYRHEIYRLDEHGNPGHANAVWSVDLANYQTSRTDEEVAEDSLVNAFRAFQEETPDRWAPGNYRIVVTVEYSDSHLLTLDRTLPLPPSWAALPGTWSARTQGVPSRAFGIWALDAYAGSTLEMVGNHIAAFHDHHTGRITTAELTERTGYRPPEGVRIPTGRT